MKVLFLSHNPHEVHLEFAKSIGARIKIVPLNWFVRLYQKINILGYIYPFLSLILSFFIRINEDILLVDGGSSLYISVFLKIRHPKIKLIFLDGDMIFYYFNKRYRATAAIKSSFFFKKIDAILSVSEQNKSLALKYVNVPDEIVYPYPKDVKKLNIKRENYGLYIGRLDSDKNIKRIVEFGLQCPYFDKFIIVGDGAYRNYIRKISLINRKVMYLGQIKDISKVYSECKFLIHIPDYDPHPCTTMESALCGCFPIISKAVGSSYLFDNLFIINNPQDFNEINEKIRYILENEKRAEKLLNQSIKKFPTKKQSVNNFRNSFGKIVKTLKIR